MERPRAVPDRRAHVRRVHPQPTYRLNKSLALSLLFVLTLLPFFPSVAHAAPVLWLPTPVGERWKILQGYGCGSHNSWDRYALDIVSEDGRTYGAPVRAAADGTVFVWEGGSGTLIIDHGGGFYTQYTHMSKALVRPGASVRQGDEIGKVGERGSPGTPHLHFHAFTATGAWARNRQTVPLSFAEGYDLPDIGGCSQHQGKMLVASGEAGKPGTISFSSDAQPNRWYRDDMKIAFQGNALDAGFRVGWDADPGGDQPDQPGGEQGGAAQTAQGGEGLHTLYVRGWDDRGQQVVVSFGPVGFDRTAPAPVAPVESQTVAANAEGALVRWGAASDGGSGVAGYRIYLGPDPAGTSEWYVTTPEAEAPALAPGSYTLRIQALDAADNASDWVTVGTVVAQ